MYSLWKGSWVNVSMLCLSQTHGKVSKYFCFVILTVQKPNVLNLQDETSSYLRAWSQGMCGNNASKAVGHLLECTDELHVVRKSVSDDKDSVIVFFIFVFFVCFWIKNVSVDLVPAYSCITTGSLKGYPSQFFSTLEEEFIAHWN